MVDIPENHASLRVRGESFTFNERERNYRNIQSTSRVPEDESTPIGSPDGRVFVVNADRGTGEHAWVAYRDNPDEQAKMWTITVRNLVRTFKRKPPRFDMSDRKKMLEQITIRDD
jgi:hypothetical protein